ncbi:MAG: hypothetical protein P8Y44_04000 [Acidobacteriota bacterium]
MKRSSTTHFLLLIVLTLPVWGQASSSQNDGSRKGAASAGTEGGATDASIATLLLSGDAAPDGNGNFLMPELPTINENGQVAAVIALSDTAMPNVDDSGIYIFDAHGASKLVRTGEPVPNGNGVFDRFSDVLDVLLAAVNDNGSVAFIAELNGTTGGSSADGGPIVLDNLGIFGASVAEGVTEYVRLTDPAPDANGMFGPRASEPFESAFSQPGIDNENRVTFRGYLTDTSGGEDRADLRVDAFDWENAADRVAIEALLDTDLGDPEDPAQRIYVASDGGIEEVFVEGGIPPDGDGKILGLSKTRIAENGNITFEGLVGETKLFDDFGSRIFFYDGITLSEIARQNDVPPGETDPTNPYEYRQFTFDSNNRDEVAFAARLGRDVPPFEDSGIYRWNGSEVVEVVRQGDPAPGGIGTFDDVFHDVFLNDNGQIAFWAPIADVGEFGEEGVFVAEASGVIHRVVQSGEMLNGAQVTGVDFAGKGLPFRGPIPRLAGMKAINNSGQLAFRATLDFATWGLFLWGSDEIFSGGFEDGTLAGWGSGP